MKKNILLLITLVTFLSANAVPILYTVRSNKCFLACGAVSDKTTQHDQILSDGSLYTYYSRHITCSGIGFKSCPSQAYQSEGDAMNAFDVANTDQLLTYAIGKIEGESMYTGNHSIQVYNTVTLKTYVYTVIWTSTNVGQEQSFQIDKVEI